MRHALPVLMLFAFGCSEGSTVKGASGGSGGSGAGVCETAVYTPGAAGKVETGTAPEPIVFPTGVTVVALEGGTGGLDVLALTVQKGATNTEVYAAVRNDGSTYACSVGFSVELFDKDQMPLDANVSDLLGKGYYRLNDGSGDLAACVAPGEVAYSAVTDLAANIAIENVGFVRYHTPFFAFDVTAIPGIIATGVTAATGGGGVSYTGALANCLDLAVTDPTVKVFPLTADGRPLGAATARGDGVSLAHGATWDFQTNALDVAATDFAVFPSATVKK